MCRFWNYINILQIILLDYIYKSTVATGWSGLGYFPKLPDWQSKRKKMVGLSQQGAWTRWDNTLLWMITSRITGGLTCTASDFWFQLSVTPYQVQQTFILGAGWETYLSCVLEVDPWNNISAAAPKPWPMVATAGATTRCSRQFWKQSPQQFRLANSTPEGEPSLSSRLERRLIPNKRQDLGRLSKVP